VALGGLTLIALVVMLYRLGAAEVCGANEAIEGLFVQQMVEHDALLFPVANGHDPMYKPPLFHWTATGLAHLFRIRKVTAFSLRAPSALYASAGVALTVGFALSVLDLESAVLAGMILLSSYQYVSQGRIGRVDMALTFFEALALFSFMWWLPEKKPATAGAVAQLHKPQGALRYLFAAALGLAVLSKGPVGAMLPMLAIAIFIAREKRWQDANNLFSPGSAMLTVALASSWYLACLFGRRYGFLDRQIGSENFGRFFGTLGWMAPTYYLKPILLNSVPTSLLVPFAVVAALRKGGANPPASDAREGPRHQVRDSAGLLAIFWIVTVAFFSLAAYKRRAYLLPLWPPAAVLIAWWLDRLSVYRWGRIARGAAFVVCAIMVVFNLFYIPSKEVRDCANQPVREAAAQINRAVGRNEPLFSYGLDQDPAPLLFYLNRQVPPLHGELGDVPVGYVIVPVEVWASHKSKALELEPVLTAGSGRRALILLHRGKLYGAL
jgi:4-amino-4-deoxy-L-arabinose transferase-like glycosyltransferase